MPVMEPSGAYAANQRFQQIADLLIVDLHEGNLAVMRFVKNVSAPL